MKDSEWYYHCFKKKNLEKAYRSSTENCEKDAMFVQKKRNWEVGWRICIYFGGGKEKERQCLRYKVYTLNIAVLWRLDGIGRISKLLILSLFSSPIIGIIFVPISQNCEKVMR